MRNKLSTTSRNCFPKLTLIGVTAVIMFFVSGCKKFLDVPPKDQVPQSTLLKSFNEQARLQSPPFRSLTSPDSTLFPRDCRIELPRPA